MSDLLSLSWSQRIALAACIALLVTAAGGLAAWKGYNQGYEKAEALGNAEIARFISEQAQTYAQAMQDLNNKLQEEAQRAMTVEYALASERLNNAKTQANLRSRIADVTRNSNYVFGAEFVRLWNEAVGTTRSSDNAAAPGAHSIDGTAGAGAAADSGVLVSEADILAYITYYGPRCMDLEAQVNAWIDLAEGWKK